MHPAYGIRGLSASSAEGLEVCVHRARELEVCVNRARKDRRFVYMSTKGLKGLGGRWRKMWGFVPPDPESMWDVKNRKRSVSGGQRGYM